MPIEFRVTKFHNRFAIAWRVKSASPKIARAWPSGVSIMNGAAQSAAAPIQFEAIARDIPAAFPELQPGLFQDPQDRQRLESRNQLSA